MFLHVLDKISLIKFHILKAFETEIQKLAMKTQHKREGKRHGNPAKTKGTHIIDILYSSYRTARFLM